MENKKHLDLMTSIVLGVVSIYIIFDSIRMTTDSGEVLYYSPGLMPLVLGCGLLVCTIGLFLRTIKEDGLQKILSELRAGVSDFFKSEIVKKTAVGLIIMGIYVFILLERLHFIVASLIFLIVFSLFLKSGSIIKILILSVATVGLTYVVFQMGFGVPLP